MFNKILIANRGEIACRVMATARRLGVKTVAVYSEADKTANHVTMADEAVLIGPAPVADSYLQADRIIQAARDTGAQAIHPGYGFLSENPDFVRKVAEAGLAFIGPTAEAIEAMGLKDAAKALMAEAGVPVVPGYHGDAQDVETLSAEAAKIGYPVLIKARAGGGGKGMRLVDKPADFPAALAAAQREGQASFGDPVCLIEKYITKPRHIEIQVFGDAHGNVVHMFERDCSLQRRHQKVIEEAPAPDMPDDVRRAMGQAAVDAAEAIGYRGAGTVEFIVDGSNGLRPDGFWFMEMNTRLQVEHPVSEAITGLDFVELQLRIAAGEPLPVTQDDLSIKGWSFEARLYAEDVPGGFLPATGTLQRLSFPDGVQFELGDVRIDSGVSQGSDISPFYDPMIAKVIVHGPTRDIALRKLTAALEATELTGTVTNLDFLIALSRDADFAAGRVSTDLIGDKLAELVADADVSSDELALAAVIAAGMLPDADTVGWGRLANFGGWGNVERIIDFDAPETAVRVVKCGGGQISVHLSDQTKTLTLTPRANGVGVSVDGGPLRNMRGGQDGQTVFVQVNGRSRSLTLRDPMRQASETGAGGDTVLAPMPGTITSVAATVGQSVTAGETLMTIEAMKMEHALAAPRDGVVKDVMAKQGDQVALNAQLISLEPMDD